MTRRRLATGIYGDPYGFSVRWRDHGQTRDQRFASDTPLDVLKAFRLRQLQQARPAPPSTAGSFTRDVARFLRTRKGRPSFKSDRAHLRPWVHRFIRLSRWAITREKVIEALGDWHRQGYSPRELRHRLRILAGVYRHFSPDQPTPCDRVNLPEKIPHVRPIAVPDQVIRDVARQLRISELAGRLRDGKTRARYLVLASTGQRPAQMKRAQPTDVDLERRVWFVRPAKGDRGGVVPLNADMVIAWQLFIAAKAWGVYDARSFAKTLRRNGWPKGVMPYALRHTVGMSLSLAGVDLGDIQGMMGHASPNTTRAFYVPTEAGRLHAASAKVDGRFHNGSATLALEPNTKARQKAPVSTTRPKQTTGRAGSGRSSKTA